MQLLQQVHKQLAECVDKLPKSICAFLATYDGHLIDSYGNQQLAIGDNLPMASSILGLSQSLISGLEDGAALDDVIVRSSDRVVAMIGVGDEHHVLYVGIVAERMVNLGQMLVMGKACADAVRAIS